MSNDFLINIARFVLFVLLQVTILNHVNFLGYINPYLYLMFILVLPVTTSDIQVIIWGFLLGLMVDVFQDTGGIHAAACLCIAYLRPKLLSISYGLSYDYQAINFYNTPLKERLTFVISMVMIHHFVLFLLVYFNLKHILLILKNTLYSGLFTIILILIATAFFQKVKR